MDAKYLKMFSKLRSDASRARWTDTTCYRAPHKPVLLLSVLDLIAQGMVMTNLVEFTPDLSELFKLYWTRVMPPDRRPNLALPFFHLKSDGFWHLVPQSGKEAFLENADQIRSINQLRDTILGARFDERLFEQLLVEMNRNKLRNLLIERYFSPEMRPALLEQSLINVEAFRYSQRLLEGARTQPMKERTVEPEQYRPASRDQGFRRAVVAAYEHRCALCGIRMLTPDGHTAVVGAHIIPWSISHNDDPRNGMALCQLCHWAFDEGLLGVSTDYIVLTSGSLVADDNIPGHLVMMKGRPIIGPTEECLWPDKDSLNWHQRTVFRAR